jgi:L-threonylcarbamoyladenylate synthase
MVPSSDYNHAIKALRNGEVIAYPTEAVYGLGCDPFNSQAVFKLLSIKRRQPEKGLILVASDWSQIENLTKPIAPQLLSHIQTTWPGPTTWVFPASDLVPNWIKGNKDTIALRVSAHPVVHELCERFCGPIVSTSANIENHPTKRDYRTCSIAFKDSVDYIFQGRCGGQKNPSTIRDAITSQILRR